MIGAANLALKIIGLGAVMALSAAPALPVYRSTDSQPAIAVAPALAAKLSSMSTGTDQEVVQLAGSDAQARNSRIPMAAGAARSLAAFTPISAGSQSYPTALRCLTQAVYYEAANEPRLGKEAVAQVVLNRLRHPAYPNSVCGVVYEGSNKRVCQFSFTCDGALTRAPLARQWQESKSVALAALSGKQVSQVGTATHYHADYVVPRWAFTLSKLQVIGRHIFYRFPGTAGEPRAFAARWARSERIPAIDWNRLNSAAETFAEPEPVEEQYTPGLTVTPDKTDRHASNDVGGRIDTTKQWRLTIPDPVNSQGNLGAAIEAQGGTDDAEAEPTP